MRGVSSSLTTCATVWLRLFAVAGRRIDEDDALVCVPRQALLTARTARECGSVGAACRALSDWQALVLKLLLERSRGPGSPFAPYIGTLPPQPGGLYDDAAFGHPLLWPDGVAESLLEGSLMLPKLQRTRRQCDEDAACIRAALAACPCGELQNLPSDGDVRWATVQVLSRAFYLPGVDDDEDAAGDEGDMAPGDGDGEAASLALVPWADALNHSSHGDERCVLQYDPDDRVAVLYAHRRYSPGEQVFDSYSPGKAPVDTLLEYGFVERRDSSAAADRADLPAACLGHVGGSSASLLAAVGLDPATAIASLGVSGPDAGVLAWLRVASATGEELQAAGWTDAAAGEAAGAGRSQAGYTAMGTFMTTRSAANETAALQRLLTALEMQCGAYAVPAAEHVAQLEALEAEPWSAGLHQARLHALRAVVSERTALEGSLAAVRAALHDLR